MTRPAETYNTLTIGQVSPDFRLAHSSGDLVLSQCAQTCILYFPGELLVPDTGCSRGAPTAKFNEKPSVQGTPSELRTLIAIAELLLASPGCDARLIVVSRQPPDRLVLAFQETFATVVSLLCDPDGDVGRLYGCQCREKHFDMGVVYDRAPLLCLLDRSKHLRLILDDPGEWNATLVADQVHAHLQSFDQCDE